MSRKLLAHSFYKGKNCIFVDYRLSLQRVFHSIRFKVNKGGDLAKSLFLYLKNKLPLTYGRR